MFTKKVQDIITKMTTSMCIKRKKNIKTRHRKIYIELSSFAFRSMTDRPTDKIYHTISEGNTQPKFLTSILNSSRENQRVWRGH